MKSKAQKEIARQRIKELFKEAHTAFHDKSLGKEYSDRYVALARKIAMKYNIRMTSEQKRKFCKHCYSYLEPGYNARVRAREGKMVYFCENCKKYTRLPYIKEQKEKRAKTPEKSK
ncbi:MAG: ribonuclease P protein component 4 [Candidatus Woesearchaeota archaeon]